MDIPVLPMVGAVVRFFPQGGGPFRTSPSLRKLSYGFSDSMGLQPSAKDLLSRVGEALAGVDLAWLEPAEGSFQGYLIVASRTVEGPVLMDLFPYVPGYRGGRRTVELLPFGEKIVHYDLELEPEASGWGTLEIFFEGLPEGEIPSQAAFGGIGRFFLREVDGTQHYEIRFREARERELHFPQGPLQWHFLSTEGFFRWPPPPSPATKTLNIGNEPERVSIDLSGLGGVECRAFRGGRPYRDSLTIRIRPVGKPKSYHVSRLSRAPYVFSLLPSGFYELEPLDPPGEPVTVFVSPGRFHAPASLTLQPQDLGKPASGEDGAFIPEEILKKLPKEIVEKLKAGGR